MLRRGTARFVAGQLAAGSGDFSPSEAEAAHIILTVANDGSDNLLCTTAAAHRLTAEVDTVAVSGVSEPTYNTAGAVVYATPSATTFVLVHVTYTVAATGGTWVLA
jgi:hypothetical protein